jgi:hypothetical protein
MSLARFLQTGWNCVRQVLERGCPLPLSLERTTDTLKGVRPVSVPSLQQEQRSRGARLLAGREKLLQQ